MRRLIVLAALALSACGGAPEKDPNAPSAPPDVASNFSQPIDGLGADGAWSLKIRGQQLTFDRPSQPTLVGKAPGAVIQPHTASWAAALPDGRTLKVSLFASPCVGGASDATYPFSVEVMLPDTGALNGCAGPAKR